MAFVLRLRRPCGRTGGEDRREGRTNAVVPMDMPDCRRQPSGRNITRTGRRGKHATAFASVCHHCERPLRVVLPAHRLGDRAGRSPGLRVSAWTPSLPSFPVA